MAWSSAEENPDEAEEAAEGDDPSVPDDRRPSQMPLSEDSALDGEEAVSVVVVVGGSGGGGAVDGTVPGRPGRHLHLVEVGKWKGVLEGLKGKDGC